MWLEELEPGFRQEVGAFKGSGSVGGHRLEDSVVSFRPNHPPNCRKKGRGLRSFCCVLDSSNNGPKILNVTRIPNRYGCLEE